jgi:hypothetical protein
MTRSPFPVPFGWFQVGWPGEVAPGEAKPLRFFGGHQVLWRDEDGGGARAGRVLPASRCTPRARRQGRRSARSRARSTAGASTARAPTRSSPIRAAPTQRGAAHVPHDRAQRLDHGLVPPLRRRPKWEIPEVAEFNDPEHFTAVQTRHYTIEAPWQDLAENGVDSAHFRFVHNTEQVPELRGYDVDGPRTSMRSLQKFPTPRGVVDGTIDADSWGPGFSVIHFGGIVDTVLMGCNTPVSANSCEMRFTFTVRKLGDDALDSTVGDAFVNEVHNQVIQDTPIWENKAYLARPALADTDGPFTKFRKWASQFYAEGIDTSAEVYEPDGSYPAGEVGPTASQKYGSAPIA